VVSYGIDRKAADENIIPCMHITFWIAKTTNTYSEYVCSTTAFSMATMFERKRLHVTFIRTLSLCLRVADNAAGS
jgi:hypothetical protein